MYESLMDLVEEKTKNQGGLPCVLNDQCPLRKDATYLETTYNELFWHIEVSNKIIWPMKLFITIQ